MIFVSDNDVTCDIGFLEMSIKRMIFHELNPKWASEIPHVFRVKSKAGSLVRNSGITQWPNERNLRRNPSSWFLCQRKTSTRDFLITSFGRHFRNISSVRLIGMEVRCCSFLDGHLTSSSSLFEERVISVQNLKCEFWTIFLHKNSSRKCYYSFSFCWLEQSQSWKSVDVTLTLNGSLNEPLIESYCVWSLDEKCNVHFWRTRESYASSSSFDQSYREKSRKEWTEGDDDSFFDSQFSELRHHPSWPRLPLERVSPGKEWMTMRAWLRNKETGRTFIIEEGRSLFEEWTASDFLYETGRGPQKSRLPFTFLLDFSSHDFARCYTRCRELHFL